MSGTLQIAVEGIGLWAPGLPGWDAGAAALCGNVELSTQAPARPAPAVLSPNERRRAPESVLLALDVAAQACAMAGRDGAQLPHVFASAYGDLAINDYLCATLARAPLEVSPTRFHNSVHNAPAGYWAIATGCRESSTAISAADTTFGAGLLEAALLAHAEQRAVLFAVFDVAASGPLTDVIACDIAFAAAWVLAPVSPRAVATLTLDFRPPPAPLAPRADLLHAVYATNPAARSLPLLVALARREGTRLRVDAAPDLEFSMEVGFD